VAIQQDPPVLTVSDLEVAARAGDIFHGVSLELRAGEVLGLVGESGSGKSTLAMALLGHVRRGVRFASGEVLFEGQDLTEAPPAALRAVRGRRIAYIPQDPAAALDPAMSVGEHIRETLAAHGADGAGDDLGGRGRRGRSARRVAELLERVRLPASPEFRNRYPHQLSGGQQQRIAIVLAFACEPAVIICDEPTTGLDVATQAHVLEVLRDLSAEQGTATLYVSHDLAVVSSFAQRVAVMYAGEIVELGSREQVFGDARHPYTRRLVSATPRLKGAGLPVGIPGYAPPPGARPAGCTFAPRCLLAEDACSAAPPPLREVSAGHLIRCIKDARSGGDPAASTVHRAAASDDVVLQVRGLSASYRHRRVLYDVSIDVRRRQGFGLVGESGSGKTTLARCVGGLHDDYTGEVRLEQAVLARSARRRSREQQRDVQYVFQNPYMSLNPRRTVGGSIAADVRLFKIARDVRGETSSLLERVGLPAATASRMPSELSGGERQRAAIARALAAHPKILICDEITSSLDISVQATIVGLLASLQQDASLTLVFITHNLALVPAICDQVAVLSDGRLVELGSPHDTFSAPAHGHTRELLRATEELGDLTVTAERPRATGPPSPRSAHA
jgi:peptide/nickel transport system ATP-binding protein